ncbi:alpha-L-fucosidase [Prolixibacteraceae bacterium]|nr:alpha-L-fucosidase [Prolixibacteraceae bacterium]
MKSVLSLLVIAILSFNCIAKSTVSDRNKKSLEQLQQDFLDLRFGMFIHFNIPTSSGHDWPDPLQSPEVFNPTKLDCNQWADAAASAGMTYACLTTKHHSGFCIWPTKTTDYNVMSSPFKRDIVKEYVDAFRKRGLKIFLYYSILDTHHNIRSGWIQKKDTKFIKKQLSELLTNYGDIDCLIIDGWDASWSRISYEEVPFKEIYNHVKSLQPNCLISEHNAGKYPSEQLFYTDVKHYEQNAGQKISKETNDLPAQAGIPIDQFWFWKPDYSEKKVKSAEYIVNENLIPLNEAHCNFILSVAPSADGLLEDNAVTELKKIGKLWKHPGKSLKLSVFKTPIISRNLAKTAKMNSSWSEDIFISDFANDDNFVLFSWIPSSKNKEDNFLEVVFEKPTEINSVGFVELCGWYGGSVKGYDSNKTFETKLKNYEIHLWDGKSWEKLPIQYDAGRVRIHDFKTRKAKKVRLLIKDYQDPFGISEMMVYKQ